MTQQQIKDLRAKHGLTQRAFGDVIGVTERTVQRWEGGDAKPSAQVLELLLIKLKEMVEDD